MRPNLWATGNSLLQILSMGNLIFLVLCSGYLNPEVVTQCRNNKSHSCWLSECSLGILLSGAGTAMWELKTIFVIVEVSGFRKSFLCKKLRREELVP